MLITVPILNVLIITIPMFSAVSVITTIFQGAFMVAHGVTKCLV